MLGTVMSTILMMLLSCSSLPRTGMAFRSFTTTATPTCFITKSSLQRAAATTTTIRTTTTTIQSPRSLSASLFVSSLSRRSDPLTLSYSSKNNYINEVSPDREEDEDDDYDKNKDYSVTTTSAGSAALLKSRRAFSSPHDAPDDALSSSSTKSTSSSSSTTENSNNLAWNRLGLWTELVHGLIEDLGLEAPTPVQSLVIPRLLLLDSQQSSSQSSSKPSSFHNNKNVAFLAATGSGKTLAYVVPLLQLLKQQEVFAEQLSTTTTSTTYTTTAARRLPQRPRLLILAPTRELCVQILQVIKRLCHSIKLSSVALHGGEDFGKQRQRLHNQPIDIVVATPGRLLKHWRQGGGSDSSSGGGSPTNQHQQQSIFLGNLQYVVLDEMDTMIEQGFSRELKQLLYPLLYHQRPTSGRSIDLEQDYQPDQAPAIILTSATMTRAIQTMIHDTDRSNLVSAKKHYRKTAVTPEAADPKTAESGNDDPTTLVLPPMTVLKAPGLHKTVPQLQQVFLDVGGSDKLALLIDLLYSTKASSSLSSSSSSLTMVFCNTAASCRAVEFALAEAGIACLSYHGELSSTARMENLQQFRRAGEASSEQQGQPSASSAPRVLVCTDLAARGLDVPSVDHVIMFDFPLNALDYLHRSGRTARGLVGTKTTATATARPHGRGRVTALVSKRDKVLANAIEAAVQRGEPLDGLSSRRSDYLPGGRLDQRGAAAGGSKRRTTTGSRSNSGRGRTARVAGDSGRPKSTFKIKAQGARRSTPGGRTTPASGGKAAKGGG